MNIVPYGIIYLDGLIIKEKYEPCDNINRTQQTTND